MPVRNVDEAVVSGVDEGEFALHLTLSFDDEDSPEEDWDPAPAFEACLSAILSMHGRRRSPVEPQPENALVGKSGPNQGIAH